MTKHYVVTYETDNGPGGISWETEVQRNGEHYSLASLEDVRAIALYALRRPDGSIYAMRRDPIAVYTLESWYEAIKDDREPSGHPDYVIEGDDG
jgi:hypothetical protein